MASKIKLPVVVDTASTFERETRNAFKALAEALGLLEDAPSVTGATGPAGPAGPSGSSTDTTASNVGSGAGVWKDKVGVDLRFRSLVGSTGVTVTQNTNDIGFAANFGLSGSAFFGTGRMGNLNFDGPTTITITGFASIVPAGSVYTLTYDIYADSMTVASGVMINTNGYRIFVKNLLTLDGTIRHNGNVGGNGSATTPGAAGATLAAGTLPAGGAGGGGGVVNGGVGTAGSPRSGIPRPGVAGASAIEAAGSTCQGGGGGHGNTAGASGDGTTGGSLTLLGNTSGLPDELGAAIRALTTNATAVLSGSGGGGGRGGNVAGSPGSTGTGGGGGSAAGFVVVVARNIAGLGFITAIGGAGGDGGAGTGVGVGGGGGGGGGGSGGMLVLSTASTSWNNTSVVGGVGGLASVSGSTAGGNGGPGLIYRFDNVV